ncbi:MAG: hypothetical protein GKR93_12030 [Gammaproteobacteria bacterium]|nr:hypothetical protein [Gammaproteobacteria bacterium]
MSHVEYIRNRLRRLRILQTLYNQRPEVLGEGILFQELKQDPDLNATPEGVRRSLDYLNDRRLAEIEKVNKGRTWTARITADGVDYLEGDDPDIPGISHPDDFIN